VTSSPAGATVSVDGRRQGVTPLDIRLSRKKKGQVIRIESPGYHPVEIRPTRRYTFPILENLVLGMIPGMVGLLIYAMKHCPAAEGYNKGAALSWSLGTAAFGGLFIIIDSGGKGFELVPKELEVRLKKAEGPRRIDTILIDADDFRNIKWIRVQRD